MKKAQSISINTIIVAAIALVVMIIVIAMTVTRMFGFSTGTDSCLANKGRCVSADDYNAGKVCNSGEENVIAKTCYKLNNEPDTTKVCCIGFGQ